MFGFCCPFTKQPKHFKVRRNDIKNNFSILIFFFPYTVPTPSYAKLNLQNYNYYFYLFLVRK